MSEFFRALEQARQERNQKRAEAASPVAPPPRPKDPAVADPAKREPAAKDPAAEEPVTREPVSREPVTREPAPPPRLPVRDAEVATPAVVAERAERRRKVGDEVVDGVDDRLVSLLEPNSFAAEQYRTLRHFVEERHLASGLSVIAVSSPGSREGKTTTAINLAGALAQSRANRVLIVDLDMRRSSVATQLGIRGLHRPGIVEAIVSGLSLDAVLTELPPFNLSIVSAGETTTAPYELLKSSRFSELMIEARRRFDYVIVDTPPILAVPDCRVITSLVDGFLVVVGAHKTPMKAVGEALDILEPAKMLGLVFNADDGMAVRGSYYGYKPVAEIGEPQGLGRAIRRLRHRS